VLREIEEGKAVIAPTTDNVWVGFCYIEAWGHMKVCSKQRHMLAPTV